jgi:hypothetical protein
VQRILDAQSFIRVNGDNCGSFLLLFASPPPSSCCDAIASSQAAFQYRGPDEMASQTDAAARPVGRRPPLPVFLGARHRRLGVAASPFCISRLPGGRMLEAIVARDRCNAEKFEARGWQVLTVWECETAAANVLRQPLRAFIKSNGGHRKGRKRH